MLATKNEAFVRKIGIRGKVRETGTKLDIKKEYLQFNEREYGRKITLRALLVNL